MATPSTLDHNNWLTVGEGLLITKMVLEPYVKQVVSYWHQMLLMRLKKEGSCVRPSSCTALNPTSVCRSCKMWFNELCKRHTGNANNICWNNTNCTKWAKKNGAWEVAKVFMSNLGKMKSHVIDEKSTDIAGLLNILRFFPNEAFGNPVSRPGRPAIEAVTNNARNPWAHSARHKMNTAEKRKALACLGLFLGENAFISVTSVKNGQSDLQTLDRDGITNISVSESKCLKLLAQELPAEVSKIEAEVKALSNTSSLQEQDICQVKNTISDISWSINQIERMLENSGRETQGQSRDLLLLKEDISQLEQEVENRLANIEEKQKHQESRQDDIEEKQKHQESRQDNIEEKQKHQESRQDDIEEKQKHQESRQDDIEEKQKHQESRQDNFEENLHDMTTQLQRISEISYSDAAYEPLESCLPDFQDKVFGRDADIDHVASLIEHHKPCVVLTGAPGFGKTTVAINLAHKLKANKVKFVFVSLREMHSIKDVCSRLLAQVGQHPKENEKEELLCWARSLKEEVVFIFDNAEDVLQDDKDAFCGLLQDFRAINSKFIQFLITSRERFAMSTMEVISLEIKELDTKEGIQVIWSMLPEGSTREDPETFTELVNLCGGIPLALRIIGSILDCYLDDITSLTQELKSFPMDTLEDKALPSYHESIHVAFECSFQKLEDSLQAKLVRLSVFRGPFTQKAAASILGLERPVLAGKVLKELTNKSLLTKSDSTKRYEMHSLIQKYLMDIKSKSFQNDFDTAKSKFIDYYASVVIEGHKLFWSKDKFRCAIEMYRSDSLNIEKALEMCYQVPVKMQKFFPIVWSASMYLEMCISLEKLNQFLESCSSSAASQNEKGVEMEAKCFLAYYEWKKRRYSKKYQTLFSNAKMLYEEQESSLRPSQKWLYKHSHGLFLDQEKKYDEAIKVTKEAVQIAESNIDTTDLSLTLNQLAVIEKHRKNYKEAESHLEKSYKKRTEVLGKNHILSIPKHLADVYLEQKKRDKALVLYEKGLDTYKALNMDKEKQCINLLKNMGSCCFQLGQLDRSLGCFHKALELAERCLDEDHRDKVLLYSELASAYYSEANRSQAKKYAQNALQMAERLNMYWGGKQNMERIMKESEEAETADGN